MIYALVFEPKLCQKMESIKNGEHINKYLGKYSEVFQIIAYLVKVFQCHPSSPEEGETDFN